MAKPAVAKRLWAPLVTPNRGKPWILFSYIASSKREAIAKYLDKCAPQFYKEHLERVKFIRVEVKETDRGVA